MHSMKNLDDGVFYTFSMSKYGLDDSVSSRSFTLLMPFSAPGIIRVEYWRQHIVTWPVIRRIDGRNAAIVRAIVWISCGRICISIDRLSGLWIYVKIDCHSCVGIYVPIDRISCAWIYVSLSHPAASIVERLPDIVWIWRQLSVNNYAPPGRASPCPEVISGTLFSRLGILGIVAANPALAKISAHILSAVHALGITACSQKAYYQ